MKEIAVERALGDFDNGRTEVRTVSALLFATAILALLAFYTARFSWTRFQVDQLAKEISLIDAHKLSACDAPTFARYFGHIRMDTTCKQLLETELAEMRGIRREQLDVSLPVLGMKSSFSDLLIVFPAVALGMWHYLRRSRQRLHLALARLERLLAPPDDSARMLLGDIQSDERQQTRLLEQLGTLTTITSAIIIVGDIYDAVTSANQLHFATCIYIAFAFALAFLAWRTGKKSLLHPTTAK